MTNHDRLELLKRQRDLLRGRQFRTSVQARRDILSAIVPLLNFNDSYYSNAVPIADVLGRSGFSSNFYDQAFAQIDSIVNQAINELEHGLTPPSRSTPEAVATAEKKEKSHPILVALIGAAGVIIVALIPIMASKCQPMQIPPPTPTPSPSLSPTPTTSAHERAVDIVSANYRRAFKLNFTKRFARKDEYMEVAKSIAASHAAVQSNLVKFTDVGDKAAAATLYSMLEKLDTLDRLFKQMEPFVGDDIRLDGTGPRQLTDLFKRAEEVRLEYIAELRSSRCKPTWRCRPFLPANLSIWLVHRYA